MNPPKVLDFITTEKSGHQGVVLEVVENRTGSYRVKYLNRRLEIRWTTVTGHFNCAYCKAGIAEKHNPQEEGN